MTTMVLGSEGLGCRPRARWRSALTHGGIVASLLAVIAALWTVLALVVALLAHPVATMTTLERDGARGVPTIVRHGTATLVAGMRDGSTTRSSR